jgi:hypothetical protein
MDNDDDYLFDIDSNSFEKDGMALYHEMMAGAHVEDAAALWRSVIVDPSIIEKEQQQK